MLNKWLKKSLHATGDDLDNICPTAVLCCIFAEFFTVLIL